MNGRRAFSRLLSDPAIAGITANDEQLKALRHRFDRLVTGEPDPERLARGAVVVAANMGAVLEPSVSDLDDETLRAQLSRILWEVVAPTLAAS